MTARRRLSTFTAIVGTLLGLLALLLLAAIWIPPVFDYRLIAVDTRFLTVGWIWGFLILFGVLVEI